MDNNRGLYINEAARRVGCHPNTLKNLERKGWIRPLRDYKNWRVYQDSDISKVQRIIKGDTAKDGKGISEY